MKMRSLLYDIGCSVCTEIAGQAEAEARGWLQVRPLQDHEMKELLAKHAPDLGRRPALITQDGDRVTVDTGWAMVAKLALGLGPLRSWRLLRRLADAQPDPTERGSSARRNLLRALSGGALVTLTTMVRAQKSGDEAESEEVSPSNELQEAAVNAVRAEVNVKIAEQHLLELGFLPSTEDAVVLKSKHGDQLTMVFYPDVNQQPDRAGVMVHERSRDGTTRVFVEALHADPQNIFDARGQYIEGALKTLTSVSIAENGVLAPASSRGYFSCMFSCIGATCARSATRCTRLRILAVVLACMVAVCGSKARTCHRVCRRYW